MMVNISQVNVLENNIKRKIQRKLNNWQSWLSSTLSNFTMWVLGFKAGSPPRTTASAPNAEPSFQSQNFKWKFFS